MSPDEKVDAITERVTLDLMDHLDDLDKYGRGYIRAYVESITGPQTTRRPKHNFHPKLAELVRDLALDAATLDRRPCGAAATPINRGDGRTDVSQSSREIAA